jgi:hypothetical protein
MSTKELLRKFRALPADQQTKFLSQARAPRRGAGSRAKRPRKVAWPDVELRARQITGGRVLPNLILIDRDESAF